MRSTCYMISLSSQRMLGIILLRSSRVCCRGSLSSWVPTLLPAVNVLAAYGGGTTAVASAHVVTAAVHTSHM